MSLSNQSFYKYAVRPFFKSITDTDIAQGISSLYDTIKYDL